MHRCRPRRPRSTNPWVLLALVGCSSSTPATSIDADWPHYAHDLGSTKYSPLNQIGPDNVAQLEVAWTWESADYDLADGYFPHLDVEPVLQSTPIKIGSRLYTSTNLGQAAAIDPETGETLWTWSPWDGTDERPSGRANRGVAWWAGPDGGERIFIGSGSHLIALDAATGRPIPSFGEGGRVDLTEDADERVNFYRWTSAPLVVRDVVIVGAQQLTPNRNWTTDPPSYIRAYDASTGELRWRFDPIAKPGEVGNISSADTAWSQTGYAGVWTMMTADPELGYVYLPLKTTTNDWYGGHRPGDNLFGESLVCLDATTGERVWHYQFVHHGLWDYDLPAAPNLVDITVEGRAVKAVAQVTKQAFVFLFDRVTGAPIWPIEERPVPSSTVPGEVAAPTQPFPTRPAPFDLQGITRDDLIDFTPELRAEAERILEDFVYGEMFTAPTVRDTRPGGKQGTILMPGWVGGANWNGAAVDPETGVIYIPSVTSPNVTALVAPNPDSSDFAYVRGLPREVPMPQGLPLLKPPYGRITAIDLNTGEHLWMKANGPGPLEHPLLKDMDLPWLGQRGRPAPLLTRTLLFLGEGSKDALSVLPIAGGRAFRAWDKQTGDVVWEMDLAAGTSGAPMTYMAGGKQYIVVPIGDHETRGQFVALRLAEETPMTNQGYVSTPDGARLFYRVEGSGADTVIAIHGGPGVDLESIAGDFTPLTERHTVIFYDQRGAGRSTLPEDHSTLNADQQIADLDAVRTHFGLEQVILVAHSYGPLLAATYALAHPDAVRRMVFFGPVPPYAGNFWQRFGASIGERLDSAQVARLAAANRRLGDPAADAVQACRDYWALAMLPRLAEPERTLPLIRSDLCASDPAGIRFGLTVTNGAVMGSYGQWDLREQLRSLAVPTLIVHGEEESIPMDMVEEWERSLPDAELLRVPQAAHFAYAEQPELVWPAVEAFLSR